MEIACCLGCEILMIARYRLRPSLVAAPGGVVAVEEVTISAVDINIIAKNKHGTGDVVQ